MAHAFYMDVHVPTALTDGLRLRGIDVVTAQEDGTERLDDDDLLARATQLRRVLFTQDGDFLRIASQWQQQNQSFTGIVYCHQLASGIGELIEDLWLIASCTTNEEVSGQVTFLPLR